MSTRRIAQRQMVSADYQVVGPKPLSYAEARDLLLLAILLGRWHRVLASCDGDLEQARAVWRMIGQAEAA
jgi:hypothetical protein